MNDQDKTKKQFAKELTRFRQRVADSEIFRSLFQESSVGTVVVTPNGHFVQANQAFCDFLGYSEPELIGQTVLFITHPEDRELSSTVIRQAAESVARIRRFKKRYLHKSGQVLWGEVSSTLICDAEGEPSYFIAQVLDITEQKRAEEALKKAHHELEERVKKRTAELSIFQRFAESSDQGFGMADMDGFVTYMNPALCRMAGVAKPEDAMGKQLTTYYPEGFPFKWETEIIPALHEKGHWEGQLAFSPTGKTTYVFQDSFLIKDVKGDSLGIASVWTDITERKRAEESLLQSHDELKAIYDGMVDGLLVTDIKALRFLRANASICRMLGYSEKEMQSLSVKDIHPPEALSMILDNICSAEEVNRTPPGNIPFLRKDGSIFYAEAIGKFLMYDGKPCSMGIFRDITERLQAEAALRQSHDELQAIYDQAVEGIVLADSETTKPIRVNAAFCKMVGYSAEEIYSMSLKHFHPPEILPHVLDFLEAAKKKSTRFDNMPFFRKDGSVIYADVVAGVIRYSERLCWIGFIHDVTQRKQAQDALERERQSLWKMLQASDHERQLISYDIHDGLAQYLAAAGMEFQVHDSMKENSPDDARKAYETAVELVRRAHNESRRLISEVRHPVIDERGLETAIMSLVHEQKQRGVPRIECHTSVEFDRLPPILENALYRMVQEALTNACKHSKSKKVTVSLIQQGQEVQLEIRDWGIGFDTEAIGKDHFGLESIRQRARLLGGRLTIESKPDSGTLVRVVVPILEKQIEK
ncbi:MAG: PAS domain S-box protein [Pirellulales bacterium]|nr:PAS domain S-box protein [Pirellulales bacterium]